MRRGFVVIVLAAMASLAGAGTAAARPRFGVTGGPQLTELVARSSAGIGRPDVTWKLAGFGGATAELPLRGRFVLASGLEYGGHLDDAAYGATLTAGGTPLTIASTRQLRQRVASMPARLEWSSRRWRLGAGSEVRYLVRAEQRWHVTVPAALAPNLAASRRRVAGPAAQIFESVQTDQWYDATSLFRRWSLAASLVAGREVPLGSHALRVDLRWSEGLTHQQWDAGSTQRSRAAQLALGWLW